MLRNKKKIALLIGIAACVMPFAWATASSVGLYFNQSTSAIPNPTANKTYVLNNGVLWMYNGTSWQSLNGPKTNLSASVAPAVGDDSADGYGIGSLWIDAVAKQAYVCVDPTVGAAVWRQYSDKDLTPKLTTGDVFADWVVSGLLGSVPGSGFAVTTPSGIAYSQGIRVVSSGYSYTYTASKDTYDYLLGDGSVNHVAVTNGAAAPTGQPGLALQKVVSNGSTVTAITRLAALSPIYKNGNSLQQAHVVLTAADPNYPQGTVLTQGTGINIATASGATTVSVSSNTAKTDAAQTFSLKQTFTAAPKLGSNSLETAAGATVTVPEATDTMATVNGTQTLDHKTLLNPLLNGVVAVQNLFQQAIIGPAAKRELLTFTPGGGLALADNTAYYTYLPPVRECDITRLTISVGGAPGGTLIITKNYGGPTLINGGPLDLSTLSPDSANTLVLTGTSASLHLLPTDKIYIEIDTLNPQPSPLDATTVVAEKQNIDY